MHVRPEARPLGWASLDEAQKNAFRRLLQLLMECISGLPKSEPCVGNTRGNPWLDPDKSSRTAFLTGGRGTGKTTVMLTLYNACLDPETLGKAAPKDITDLVNDVRPRIQWLEPIDMEPLPSSANLLAAILARIGGVVKQVDAQQCGCRGLLEPTTDLQAAVDDLNRLRTNVAIAWDGNIESRKPQLDADAFAIELMRVEDSRLDLLPTLRGVLDRLTKAGLPKDPLFLLPIDDFDLNPVACVSLLRLLRMISVPRLFTLVLGDVDVANVIMQLKFSRDLAEVYGEGIDIYTGGEGKNPLLAEVARIAGDVSANAMRKLIPPRQRIELPMLSVVEALNFRPPGTKEGDKRLHELLGDCVIERVRLTEPNVEESNLREFLLQPGPIALTTGPSTNSPERAEPERKTPGKPSERTIVREDLGPYRALNLFRSTPRRITDLWLGLHGLMESRESQNAETNAEKLLDFFAEYCRQILAEAGTLTPEGRRTTSLALRPTATGDWDFTALPFYVQSQAGAIRAFVRSHTLAEDEYRLRFQFGSGGDWRFEVDPNWKTAQRSSQGTNAGREYAERRDRAPDLSPDTAGALMLVHDLLALGPNRDRLQASLIHWDFGDQWATVEWMLGLQQRMKMRWPPPPGSSFFEFDQFTFMWRNALQHIVALPEQGFESIVAAAFHWIDAGTAVFDQRPPQFVASFPTKVDWSSLRTRLEALIPLVNDHASACDKAAAWLSDVCIITMPERGLPAHVHGLLAGKRSKLHDYWGQRAGLLIQQRRVTRLAEMSLCGLSKLAESFRSAEYLDPRLVPSKDLVAREAAIRGQPAAGR